MDDKKLFDHLVRLYLECARGQMPSGHVYAAVMQYGATLNLHMRVIGLLSREGLITVEHHVLRITDAGAYALNRMIDAKEDE